MLMHSQLQIQSGSVCGTGDRLFPMYTLLQPNGLLLSPRGSRLALREVTAAAGVSLCDFPPTRLGRDAFSAGGIVP